MEQYIAEITQVVRDADQAFQKSGGSSRHWVRECFLPTLEAAGFTIAKANASPPTGAVWVRASERHPPEAGSYWGNYQGLKQEIIFKPGGRFISLLGKVLLERDLLWLDDRNESPAPGPIEFAGLRTALQEANDAIEWTINNTKLKDDAYAEHYGNMIMNTQQGIRDALRAITSK